MNRMNALSASIKASSAILTLLMFWALAKSLGAKQYGEFATIFSLASFLAYIILLGQHTRIVKNLSTLVEKHEWSSGKALLRRSFFAVVFAVLLLTISAILLHLSVRTTSVGDVSKAVIYSLPLVVALAFSELLTSAFRGVGSVGLALAPKDVLWRLMVIIFCIVPYLNLFSNLTAGQTTLAVAVVLIGLSILQALALFIKFPDLWSSDARVCTNSNFWAESGWFWVASIVGIMSAHISVVLVSFLLSDIQTGAFFASLKVSQALQLPVIAANIVAAPIFAKSFSREDFSGLQSACRSIMPFLLICSSLGLVAISLAPAKILGSFNEDFEFATKALIILSASQFFNSLCGPTGSLMLMAGGEKRLVVIVGLSETLGLFLLLTLTPPLGLVGAAIAVLIGKISWNVLSVHWCWTVLHVDPTILNLLRQSRFGRL